VDIHDGVQPAVVIREKTHDAGLTARDQ